MRLCVDENIPRITVDELRRLGHDVQDIRGTGQQGVTDDLLWSQAQADKRLLITTDKGFVSHRNEQHHGVLIVRLKQPNERKIHSRVIRAMKRFAEHEWPGLLVVMRDRVQSIWRAA
jgi:predicted nuclease of predicted toxin-antitoxin system